MAIGFDPETEICYFLTTAIDFSEPLNGHEMSFWVSAEHSNGFEETLWDGTETRFIRRPDRGLVWQAILLGLRVLVTWIGPERVLMLTIREHLPDRAVQKYLQINRVFVELGYSVTECDPRHVATVLKCHRRRQFRNVTGRYGAAVGAAETSHIACSAARF
jgi:hypothetical protein